MWALTRFGLLVFCLRRRKACTVIVLLVYCRAPSIMGEKKKGGLWVVVSNAIGHARMMSSSRCGESCYEYLLLYLAVVPTVDTVGWKPRNMKKRGMHFIGLHARCGCYMVVNVPGTQPTVYYTTEKTSVVRSRISSKLIFASCVVDWEMV